MLFCLYFDHRTKRRASGSSLLVLSSSLVALVLLQQNDENATEHRNQVKEQVHRVFDAIGRSGAVLLHNHLCVEQHKASHRDETNVQLSLRNESMQMGQ